MKKSKIHILWISVLIICVMLAAFMVKYSYDKTLKVNEIKIGEEIVQLTNNEIDYLEYESMDGVEIYANKYDFKIEIQDPHIFTYKNIRVGDSVDKLDFCNTAAAGMLHYFETDYRCNGSRMTIWYSVNPFDDVIIAIRYKFGE